MQQNRSTQRYQNELARRPEERRSRRNESGKSKPFTGFTSPYRRLNEQALLQKTQQQHDTGRHSSKRSIFSSPSRIGDYRHSQSLDNPHRRRYDRKRFDSGAPRSNTSSRYDSYKYPPPPKSAYDSYRSNYDPWNSKLSRELEHNNRYASRTSRRERDDSSDRRAEQWDSCNRGRDFEAPMDPREFEQQCKQAYLRAAQERQRNADMSVWGKCDWATYDRYK